MRPKWDWSDVLLCVGSLILLAFIILAMWNAP